MSQKLNVSRFLLQCQFNREEGDKTRTNWIGLLLSLGSPCPTYLGALMEESELASVSEGESQMKFVQGKCPASFTECYMETTSNLILKRRSTPLLPPVSASLITCSKSRQGVILLQIHWRANLSCFQPHDRFEGGGWGIKQGCFQRKRLPIQHT